MRIKQIDISNYKTYRELHLDLTLLPDRPLIVIGGGNGCGKTTLFQAIRGALYGLSIRTQDDYTQLLNSSAGRGDAAGPITLRLTFDGRIGNKLFDYVLTRTYSLNGDGRPVEVTRLGIGGTIDRYESCGGQINKEGYASKQRIDGIIKANLPEAVSSYFLFDAQQTRDQLEAGAFGQMIRDNIDNVLGFSKFRDLEKWSQQVKEEQTARRLKAEEECKQYNSLCAALKQTEQQLQDNQREQSRLSRSLSDRRARYDAALNGQRNNEQTQRQIAEQEKWLQDKRDRSDEYTTRLIELCDTPSGFDDEFLLPRLSDAVSDELRPLLVQARARLSSGLGQGDPATLRAAAAAVLELLRERGVELDPPLTAQEVVQTIEAQRAAHSDQEDDNGLTEEDVSALDQLLARGGANPFRLLMQQKADLERELDDYDRRKDNLAHLRTELNASDAELIADYERQRHELEKLQEEAKTLKKNIDTLKAKINKIDVEVQQVPDRKYDTLAKLPAFFREVREALLTRKKQLIEHDLCAQLNKLMPNIKGHIGRVSFSYDEATPISLWHEDGNAIPLSQLSSAQMQVFIQVLLMVLHDQGDYTPPVMIDTVTGFLDTENREAFFSQYLPNVAEQTIVFSNDAEIRPHGDIERLQPYLSRLYTVRRDAKAQLSTVTNDYFGVTIAPQ